MEITYIVENENFTRFYFGTDLEKAKEVARKRCTKKLPTWVVNYGTDCEYFMYTRNADGTVTEF